MLEMNSFFPDGEVTEVVSSCQGEEKVMCVGGHPIDSFTGQLMGTLIANSSFSMQNKKQREALLFMHWKEWVSVMAILPNLFSELSFNHLFDYFSIFQIL
jgi:hypothetical protein